jgi:hypothetical protein
VDVTARIIPFQVVALIPVFPKPGKSLRETVRVGTPGWLFRYDRVRYKKTGPKQKETKSIRMRHAQIEERAQFGVRAGFHGEPSQK